MSLQYLLDGYNVIKQSPLLAPMSLRDGRDGLLRLIESRRPQGSANNTVTIVFDGQEGIAHEQPSRSVRVVFSANETADELLKRMVAAARHKKNIIVVTNDRPLGFAVRALGARTMGVQAFLQKGRLGTQARSGGKKKGDAPGEKSISVTDAYRITTEFKKIWLKDGDKAA